MSLQRKFIQEEIKETPSFSSNKLKIELISKNEATVELPQFTEIGEDGIEIQKENTSLSHIESLFKMKI